MTGEPASPTDRPPAYLRHDLIVLAVAGLLITVGGVAYHDLSRPKLVPFARDGLQLRRPAGFFPPVTVEEPPTALAGLSELAPPTPTPATAAATFHQMYRTPDGPLIGLEIAIERRPGYQGIGIVLQQTRRQRYGAYLWMATTSHREIHGRDWLRTTFRYATKATETDAPAVATGIEYATVSGGRLYAVTVHGTPAQAQRLEQLVLTTLNITQGEG